MKFKENQWSNAKKAVERVFSKKNYEVVIVPHNLKKKLQPLDISGNKAAKSFVFREI